MKTRLIMILTWLASSAINAEVRAPEGAKAYFVGLQNGDVVSSPLTINFGLTGMGVAPAGVDPAVFKHVGHHHLFINTDVTNDMLGQAIPADEHHLHFGHGQTETTISLAPGIYTLRLVMGDPYHRIHSTVVASELITIQVKENQHED